MAELPPPGRFEGLSYWRRWSTWCARWTSSWTARRTSVADQPGFLNDKAAPYVGLLKAAAADYHADIPLQVLKVLDEEKDSNSELFTKAQLEKCQLESELAAAKADTLEMLKEALQTGLQEEIE
ncbi:rna polymerase ii mediator complex subunit 10 [Phytophthora cinnamomi]|uniref:rna polymerase ii mediator complex subunit 10 n=1 Tax=Phytophthora cinnamomi TaxID=4785 RepID=UPI003559D347|nr:rna polymerase ii mediator complex subunit 10 [Phytophthora cinnamomi]